MRILKLFIIGGLLGLTFFGCSSSNKNNETSTPGESSVHPSGWLNPASGEFHGDAYFDRGDSYCGTCHGADLLGLGGIPGCDRCHFSFSDFARKTPVDSAWQHGTVPHDQLMDYGTTCNNCHNALRQFPGQGPANCHDCHALTMHPLGQAWLDVNSATFHGLAAQVEIASCAGCHGSNYLGGVAGVSCSQCHFGPTGAKVPPGVDWTHGTVPHNAAGLVSELETCNQCHTTSRLYGNGPASCHDCHVSATHPLGQTWLDKSSATFHGLEAQTSLSTCATCHGGDYLGGSSGVSCSRCHFGPSGSKVPEGSSWMHGTIPHNTAELTAAVAICNQCHTTSRLYGNGPASCHDCHPSSPHPLGQAWLDKNSATFHGAAALTSTDDCRICHGVDLQGGITGVSCSSQCHFSPSGDKVPPGSNWIHGTTPHQDLAPHIAICTACHDLNRLYGNGPAACHDCHVGAANHPIGQEWLDVNSPTFHGIAAQADIDSCAVCHGADFQGGSVGRSCYECHFGPTGSKNPPNEGAWVHGTTPHSSSNFTAAIAVCNQCHTVSRQYGNGPASCHDCHVGANHPLGQSWLDVNSATFHGTAAQADIDSCAVCHGSDFQGGSAGRSCYECHFGPTGSKNPPGESSWTHGTVPHSSSNFTAAIAICNQCHTVSRLYGNGPAACHDCHGSGVPHAIGADWLLPTQHAQQSIDNRSYCLGCHNITGTGGTDPTCVSCHTQSSPPLTIGSCTSCHGRPPSTGRHGDHGFATCDNCHSGFGTGSLNHYYPDPSPPADVQFSMNPGDDMTATFDTSGNLLRCFNTCHGENHGSSGRSW